MLTKVEAGETILVKGPARLEVSSGRVEIFGKPLEKERPVVVRQGDSLPVEGKTSSKLSILAEENQVEKIVGSSIPPSWRDLAEEIDRLEKPRVIVVLGDVNTGKTALITYLANTALTRGSRVAIVDLDVGQHNIGPPTTIGMGVPRKSIITMGDVPVDAMAFVGATSPHRHLLRIIIGAKRLFERARTMGADSILVDTTGWIYGTDACEFKVAKVKMIDPSMIVAVQRRGELRPILSQLGRMKMPVRLLGVPTAVDKRTQGVRRFRRESSFGRYFSKSRSLVLSFSDLDFRFSVLGNGDPLSREIVATIERVLGTEVVYSERTRSDCLVVTSLSKIVNAQAVQAIRALLGVDDVTIISKGEERGLIVGLLNDEGDALGLGIVQRILYDREKIRILTPVREKFTQVCFGSIRLSETGIELEHVSFRM